MSLQAEASKLKRDSGSAFAGIGRDDEIGYQSDTD